MTIHELRILPPLAVARLGSAERPLDNYTLADDPERPLDFRRIVPAETLDVDEATGAVVRRRVPDAVQFKEGGRFRPVAPFLEVWARTGDAVLEPLTLDLLAAHGLGPDALTWRVEVANRKVARRTRDPNDAVTADTGWFGDDHGTRHDARALLGRAVNFVADPAACIDFGRVRWLRPTPEFPEIRLRFTPARGLIYGTRGAPVLPGEERFLPAERRVYDIAANGGRNWYGFQNEVSVSEGGAATGGAFEDETMPPSLFAISTPAPPWLHRDVAVSRGYLDDACDGIVTVRLALGPERVLEARGRITAGPPTVVPDAGFVRTLADDLDQALHGPDVPTPAVAGEAHDDAPEAVQARACDIVRRGYETVRFLNVTVMNGNAARGRPPLALDTMPAEEAFDTQRMERPVMAVRTVDMLHVMALHQQVHTALRAGAAPWFVPLLRRPEEVADFTDHGRRKMPALMCGADGSYLALTHRQIATIRAAALPATFAPDLAPAARTGASGAGAPSADAPHTVAPNGTPNGTLDGARPRTLHPRNRSAQLHHVAAGNPPGSRLDATVGNCTPGLEMDFRAVWRRLFEGLVLREYDNLVVDVDDARLAHLRFHRLLAVDGIPMVGRQLGPSPADPEGAGSTLLATDDNPHGLAPLEWSNALARTLWDHAGGTVTATFSPHPSRYAQVPYAPDGRTHYPTATLRVREFFEGQTAVISAALAQPGELTQGLCSPWQNDYRECSCYYWASARPDFVNVEVGADGTSRGDNWLQKVRTGDYVPDDYMDRRLVLYEELFEAWEQWLRVQVGGRDLADDANAQVPERPGATSGVAPLGTLWPAAGGAPTPPVPVTGA